MLQAASRSPEGWVENRAKLAELMSTVGALALGIGLGALFQARLTRVAVPIALAGTVVHAIGMWDRHRLDVSPRTRPARWILTLYWLCWLLLAGAVVTLLVER